MNFRIRFGSVFLPPDFWLNVIPIPEVGCWLWMRHVNPKGYGTHGRRARYSRSRLVHRYTFEIFVGPVPSGHELDHHGCQVRLCCYPMHLEPVTHAENVRRSIATRRAA